MIEHIHLTDYLYKFSPTNLRNPVIKHNRGMEVGCTEKQRLIRKNVLQKNWRIKSLCVWCCLFEDDDMATAKDVRALMASVAYAQVFTQHRNLVYDKAFLFWKKKCNRTTKHLQRSLTDIKHFNITFSSTHKVNLIIKYTRTIEIY